MAGYEMICKSVGCAYNEDGFSCRLESSREPVVLEMGRCVKFEPKGSMEA